MVLGEKHGTNYLPYTILKLHIWESSLTVRLSNPHMRKQENMVEKMERNM